MSTEIFLNLQSLAPLAVLGVDRAGHALADPRALLTRASILGARERAGRLASHVSARFPDCPVDLLPVAHERTLVLLQRFLAEKNLWLIEEWAELAASRGVRADPAMLPAMLDWWSNAHRKSEAVFRVTCARGAWLCSLNSAWSASAAESR